MSTLALEWNTTQRVHETWLGKAFPWKLETPPLQVRGFTVIQARTQRRWTETVSLTREDYDLDRQAHPQAVIEAGLRAGYAPCHPRLVRVIIRLARPKRSRFVILLIQDRRPLILHTSGHHSRLQVVRHTTLDDLCYVPFSVIMAKS